MAQYWTIKEVAKAAGTTSRTLRHYDAIGLLNPTDVGENGYRLYNASALIRLQRILALRELGIGLAEIGRVLDRDHSEIDALIDLEKELVKDSHRLHRQIASVQRTIRQLQKGESPMDENMFDGFQHEKYKDEVEQRWGKDAYARSDAWWTSKTDAERKRWQDNLEALNAGWQQAAAEGVAPGSDVAQKLAERHIAWLRDLPEKMADADFVAYVNGLGEMYVNDPRFAANYGGEAGATLVRDALKVYLNGKL